LLLIPKPCLPDGRISADVERRVSGQFGAAATSAGLRGPLLARGRCQKPEATEAVKSQKLVKVNENKFRFFDNYELN
jgi:hypothetical protein